MLLKKQKPSDLFTVVKLLLGLFNNKTTITAGKTEPNVMQNRFLKYNFQV